MILQQVSDYEMDPWRHTPNSHRSAPVFALPGGSASEDNARRTMAVQKTTSELQKPAAPVSLSVAEFDQPRPWRYVRWRKANERQSLFPSEQKVNQPKGNCVYKVLPGEDLADVALKFDTYTEVLTEANKILNPHNVATGQLLWVPKTHLIKRGNTLWSLSRSFGVSIATIQKANGIENADLIFAGDILVIPEELD